MSNNNRHEIFEKSVPMLVVGIIFAISLGGLVEITPLFFQKQTTEPVEGLKPYTALQMEGRDIFIREGCTNCHSQMIRPFRAETERYGHYSVAGESVWEHPSCGVPSVQVRIWPVSVAATPTSGTRFT